MADRVPVKQLAALTRRDEHVCVMTGQDTERLVPQHRQGGMGGRADKHRLVNLLWLDSILNGEIEGNPELQAIAKAWGVKVTIHVDDVARVPVYFPTLRRWFALVDDTREEVPPMDALDRMHAVYGDGYFAWKAIADRAERSGVLYLRGGAR